MQRRLQSHGRTWDRTRPKGKRLDATGGNSASALQGDSESSAGDSGQSETTSSDSAFGQETNSDDPDLDDDPRSQRGPSEPTEPADKPGMTGREPPD